MEDKGRAAPRRPVPKGTAVLTRESRRRRLGFRASLSFLLLFALTATTVMAVSALVSNRRISSEAFGLESKRIELGITKAIEWYARTLYGLRGLFDASVSVEPQEFTAYVNDYYVKGLYPGIQAFSYVEKVCGADSGTASSTDPATGLVTVGDCTAPRVDYGLTPGEHYIVKYGVTPDGPSTAIGRDIGQIGVRKGTIDTAVDSDAVAFTQTTQILSHGESGPLGFAAYLPIYARGSEHDTTSTRRDAVVGLVSMSFETQAFFGGVIGSIGVDPGIGIHIFDDLNSGHELRYSSGDVCEEEPAGKSALAPCARTTAIPYAAFGRNWLFRTFAPQDYRLTPTDVYEPYFWLVLGVILILAILGVYALLSRAEAAERRAANEARTRRELLEMLMENLPVGVVITSSPAGAFATMNSAARSLLGRDIGTDIDRDNYAERFDLVREDGTRYPLEELPLARTLKNGRPAYVRDAYVRRPDGSMRAMRMTSALVRGGEGRSNYVIMLGEDVSREVALEKAKANFASLAAHQLKTPPVAVSWCAEMLADPEIGKLNRKQKEYVDRIAAIADRMKETVDALLVISRVEIGTFRIEAKPFDLSATVGSEVASFADAAKRAKLSLSFERVGRAIPNPTNDERLVRIMVHNLVDNAIRYTPSGGRIAVEARREDGSAAIEVRDTGIGIPKDQQQSIFGRFFRADNAIRMNSEGSGLGLAVVKTIAERIGCEVSFVSEEGKGTTFTLRIPLNPAKTKKG